MADFTHLHVHTEYSLLDGLSHLDKLIARAKKQKMKSLAVTDHGVMYAAVKFHNSAKAADLNPIIGLEGYLTSVDHHNKEPGVQKLTYHQLLLAKDLTGYKNLMKLTTIAHLEGYYYRPRFDFSTLEKHSKGLIATSSCLQGIIPQLILAGQLKEAEKQINYFASLFKDNFYLELQKHIGIPELDRVNKALFDFSRKLGLPLVSTNDVHYVEPDDAKAQDALLAIQTKTILSDKDRMSMLNSPDYYLKSAEEMRSLFPDIPEASKNTLKIADQCHLDIPTGKWILPKFPLPDGYTSSDKYFRDLANQGLKQRFKKITQSLQKRLDYELEIIISKGFSTYFLIVADFVNWAKKHHIRVGPGRGSVAGSLVAYAIRITSIDPIEHNIPFERFMNPQRPSPPDIDLDFADDKRDRVIEYVAKKYGTDHVAQIITFGTMEARGAVRDIGRVLGLPYSEPDKIAKLIPVGFSIEEAMVNVNELQEFYKQSQLKELLDLAKKVEGTARHASTHAAGVVIGDKPLTEYTPLQIENKNNRVTTQYDMYSLDCNVDPNAIGLLKIDFLGLRNLTILQNAIEFVVQQTGHRVDISESPLDEPKVFKLLSQGNTIGVFQLESAGMRRVARKLQPSRFSDITAMVALYRPGPMELIDTFIEGKKNPQKVKYPHIDLKPVLEETYGIAVYQEQALQIANVMAGFSLGEADILRRAIGKKKRSIMIKEKLKFDAGAKTKGYSKAIADKVWSYIERFAGYGFNKAHATAYAMIAYQTAYMKALYPVEFMAAVLTAESGNQDKITIIIEEAKKMNIKVFPPDINSSCTGFTIEKEKKSLNQQAIRFGLSAIKNVGEAAIGAIIKARDEKKFASLTDFCRRVDQQKVNKKVFESLIQVGAMDQFGNRAQLLMALESIRTQAADIQKQLNSQQVNLFASDSKAASITPMDKLPETQEFAKIDLLGFEKQLLGFYLSEHPLGESLKKVKKMASHQINNLDEHLHLNQTVTLGGSIKNLKTVITKKSNQQMAFATLDDDTGTIELVIFPKIYNETRSQWQTDQPILVTGKLDFRDRLSLLVESVKTPDAKELASVNFVTLNIPSKLPKNDLVKINQLLQANPGQDQITLKIKNHQTTKNITIPYPVNYQAIKSKIAQIIDAST